MRPVQSLSIFLTLVLGILAGCASGPSKDPLAAMKEKDWNRAITLISEELASMGEPANKQEAYHMLNRMNALSNCHFYRYEQAKDMEDLKASVRIGKDVMTKAEAVKASGLLGEGVLGTYPDLIVIKSIQEEFLPEREALLAGGKPAEAPAEGAEAQN